jgi:hypothetical protein
MVLAAPALDGSRGPGRLHDMRSILRSFLLGFGVVFFGWYLLLVIRPDVGLIVVLPVLLGMIAALVARRLIGMLGAIVGLLAWYAVAIAVGQRPGDDWQGAAIMFPLLIASGFAGGLALLWLRSMRGTAARS